MFHKKNQQTVVWLFLLVTSVCIAVADVDSTPYLRLGTGARSVGMAGAFAAIADGASATVLNPAGLTGVRDLTFTLATQQLSFDRTHSFIGVAKNINSQSTVGFSLTSFGVDGIPEISSSGEDLGNSFSYGSGAYTLSYGHALEQVSLGASARIISDKFGLDSDSRSTGLGGLDLGLVGKLYSNTFSYGLAFRNLGGETTPSLDLGAAFRYGGKNAVTIALDLSNEFSALEEQATAVKIGVEYVLANMFAVRAGSQRTSDRTSLYGGFGVSVSDFGINYAIKLVDNTDYDVVGDKNTHYISLSYGN